MLVWVPPIIPRPMTPIVITNRLLRETRREFPDIGSRLADTASGGTGIFSDVPAPNVDARDIATIHRGLSDILSTEIIIATSKLGDPKSVRGAGKRGSVVADRGSSGAPGVRENPGGILLPDEAGIGCTTVSARRPLSRYSGRGLG